MATRKNEVMTLPDFFQKMEWEGGLEGGLSYGLNPAEDLSKDDLAKYPEFAELWADTQVAMQRLNQYIDEHFEDIRDN